MATEQRTTDLISGEPKQHGAAGAVAAVPPLENGDRLTRSEFERRYDAMPHLKKAELIEGVVYVGSPGSYDKHGQPDSDLQTWVGVYRAATPGTMSAGNTTVRLDLDNVAQPDLLLRLEAGGTSRIGPDGYVEGAPELVIEIAASSASYDLHDKLRVYRRSGVEEYLVWRVLERAVDWFGLREGTYVQLEPDEAGVIRSERFPGLWLAVPALLDGNLAAVLGTLQEGLGASEHAAFVEQLRQAQVGSH